MKKIIGEEMALRKCVKCGAELERYKHYKKWNYECFTCVMAETGLLMAKVALCIGAGALVLDGVFGELGEQTCLKKQE